MAHSGKRTWLVTDRIWDFAGMGKADVLCERCFQNAVLARAGRERENPDESLWETLDALARAKLLPTGGSMWWLVDFADAVERKGELEMLFGAEMLRTETFIFGLRDGKPAAVRYGKLRNDGAGVAHLEPPPERQPTTP